MTSIEKTIFLSYRRTDVSWALLLFSHLTKRGYDVFFDYKRIASGDFERIIVANIQARAHFLVLLTPTALDRCGDSNDWLGREIKLALESHRNIVPIALGNFDFNQVMGKLTGDLALLSRYNALSVPADYFDQAMDRLCETYLNVPLDAVLHPASEAARQAAQVQQAAAIADVEDRHFDSRSANHPIEVFNPHHLEEITRLFAKYVGPMAKMLVRRAVGRATSWEDLNAFLSREVTLTQRVTFEKEFAQAIKQWKQPLPRFQATTPSSVK